jgi:hypothetical protein
MSVKKTEIKLPGEAYIWHVYNPILYMIIDENTVFEFSLNGKIDICQIHTFKNKSVITNMSNLSVADSYYAKKLIT